jgi:very-short-patch-repair endonuclease
MGTKRLPEWSRAAWALTRRQHGVVTRAQLLALGMPAEVIRGRLEGGRLHALWPGIYAVGRRQLGELGRFKAATLAGGGGARLAGRSAAALWRIRTQRGGPIEIAIPRGSFHRRRGIRVRRPSHLGPPHFVRGIPVDDPVTVLVDLAAELPAEEVEDAVNEADRLDLVPTPHLRRALDRHPRRRGRARLQSILDAQTFSRSQTALERRFLALVRAAGLPVPTSQERLGKYRVDFSYPEHNLVVETDGLRHHRTAAEQTTDIERDQAHVRAGLRTLRFTHFQVFHRPGYVRAVLADTLTR